MKSISLSLAKYSYKTVIYDILALAVITFAPAISHMLALPIYLLEPMRIILLLSIVHTSKRNVYLLAVALPLFSFIISAHPTVIKSLLISSEMMLNVFLFFYLLKYSRNSFLPAVASIFLSKIFYYTMKFALISFGLITAGLVTTPIILQLIVGISISVYLWFFFRKETIS